MKLFAFLLGILICISPVYATDNQTWDWVVRDSEIIAFNEAEQQQTILTLNEISAIQGWRLDEETALVMLLPFDARAKVTGAAAAPHIYMFGAQTAVELMPDFPAEIIALERDEDYGVIRWRNASLTQITPTLYALEIGINLNWTEDITLLVDTQALTVNQFIETDRYNTYPRFTNNKKIANSQLRAQAVTHNGTQIDYVIQQDNQLIVRRYNRVTGTDEAYFVVDSAEYVIYWDIDSWLFLATDWTSAFQVNSAGIVEPVSTRITETIQMCQFFVSTIVELAPGDDCYVWWQKDDMTFVATPICNNDGCSLYSLPTTSYREVLASDLSEASHYDIPANPSLSGVNHYTLAAVLPDNRLVFSTTLGGMGVVGIDGQFNILAHFIWEAGQQISPDRRWIAGQIENSRYGVWSTEQEAVIFEFDWVTVGIHFNFIEDYLQIFEGRYPIRSKHLLYRLSDGVVFDPPDGRYLIMFGNGDLLYEPYDPLKHTIYRYSPDEDTATFLLDGTYITMQSYR